MPDESLRSLLPVTQSCIAPLPFPFQEDSDENAVASNLGTLSRETSRQHLISVLDDALAIVEEAEDLFATSEVGPSRREPCRYQRSSTGNRGPSKQ